MKGSYVLILSLPKETEIAVGNHPKTHFLKGYYAYVGSAMGGLEARLKRHLAGEKKLHWHIDYLSQYTAIEKIIYAESTKKLECLIARYLDDRFSCMPFFGSSDCGCTSHLFYSAGLEELAEEAENAFLTLKTSPTVYTQ